MAKDNLTQETTQNKILVHSKLSKPLDISTKVSPAFNFNLIAVNTRDLIYSMFYFCLLLSTINFRRAMSTEKSEVWAVWMAFTLESVLIHLYQVPTDENKCP